MKEEILKELRQEQKKSIRRTTILIVALGIIFGSIAGVTAYTISAKEIGYSPKDSSWKVNNVADAIESLKTLKGGTQNYSLDEQVVGTWTDGKPIYQKTYIISSTVSGYNFIDVSSDSIENLISYDGFINGKNNSGEMFDYPIGVYVTSSEQSTAWLRKTRKQFVINIISTDNNQVSKLCYVTLRYTKTTDNATNS